MLKSKVSRGSMAMLLVAAMMICISCASEKKDWDRAQTTQTIEGYEAFLNKHPQSPRSLEAKAQIEQIAFGMANKKSTIEGYQDFLREYPDSALADQAFTRLQELTLKWSFKVVLTRIVSTATSIGKRMNVKDIEKDKGAAILLETKGVMKAKGISTNALFAKFEIAGQATISLCAGVGLGSFISKDDPNLNGAWFFAEEGNPPGFSMAESEKPEVQTDPALEDKLYKEIWLLYAVPKEVKKLTLFYNDVQITRPFSIEDVSETASENIK